MSIRRKLFLAGLCSVLGMPAIGLADDPAPRGVQAGAEREVRPDRDDVDDTPDVQNADRDNARRATRRGRWLGLHVGMLPPVLRDHLKLDHGVMAEEVLPDTPAAKAGLETGDILLSIDDAEITSPEDVRKAVDAAKEDAALTISVLHDGEKATIKVKPGDRPGSEGADDRVPPMGPFRRVDPRRQEAFERAMQRLGRSLEGGEDMNMMFLRPGIVADAAAARLPKGTTISVTRSEGEPAKIVVQRGDEHWEVTEKELDKIPEDLRGHVAAMLGGPTPIFTAPGPDARRALRVLPNGEVVGELHLNPLQRPLPPAVAPEAASRQEDNQMRQVLEALEKLNKRVEELQDKVDKKL